MGITRAKAYKQLSDSLTNNRDRLKALVAEQLLQPGFVEYLVSQAPQNTTDLQAAYQHYQGTTGQENTQAMAKLQRYAEDLVIQQGYLDYDLCDRRVDAGWAHPAILQLLAHMQGIALYIWCMGNDGQLLEHALYPHDKPAHASQRADLLFVNNNHFDRLKQVGHTTTYHQSSSQNERIHKPLTYTTTQQEIPEYSTATARLSQVTKQKSTAKNRKGLHDVDKRFELPDSLMFGEAVDDGGCFFDALAQSINEMKDNNDCNEKILRNHCHNFYHTNKQQVDDWNKEDKTTLLQPDEYYFIQYTDAELFKDFNKRPPIWGRPAVEGRMLLKELNLPGILVIEILQDMDTHQCIPGYYKVTEGGYQQISDEQEISTILASQFIPKLAVGQKSLHFVPILLTSVGLGKRQDSQTKPETKIELSDSHHPELGTAVTATGISGGTIFGPINVHVTGFAQIQSEAKMHKQSITSEQITQALRNCYRAKDSFPRLLGKPAKIADCFINLALIHQQEQTDKDQKLKRADKDFANSYEAIYAVKEPLEPKAIFKLTDNEQQKNADQSMLRRVLVTGGAGTGKTTLCQRLAYDWARGKLWSKQFDALIWLPLRQVATLNLTGLTVSQALPQLIKQFCFQPDHMGSGPYAEVDIMAALQKIPPDRVLYLLDGFDEVAHLLNEQDEKQQYTFRAQVLQFLIQQQQATYTLLTSRPYYVGVISNRFGRQLENIGFVDDNISAYIQAYFKADTTGKAEALAKFLKQNPSIWGTAHIPINLELICYTWEDENISLNNSMTISNLYQKLEDALLRRYLNRRSYNPLSTHTLNTEEQIVEKEQEAIRNYLAQIAFTGFIRQPSVILPGGHVTTVIKQLSEGVASQGKVLKLTDILESQFLKPVQSEDSQRADYKKDYYFIHLTFQEYFAAQFLVSQVQRGQPIPINDKQITFKEFVATYKYNPRYQLIWQFVAGILTEKPLTEFFSYLYHSPSDLLGLYHYLLIVRCLDGLSLEKLDHVRKEFPNEINKTHAWLKKLVTYKSNKRVINTARYHILSYLMVGGSFCKDICKDLASGNIHLNAQTVDKIKREFDGITSDSELLREKAIAKLTEGNTLTKEELARILDYLMRSESNSFNKFTVARILVELPIIDKKIYKRIIAQLIAIFREYSGNWEQGCDDDRIRQQAVQTLIKVSSQYPDLHEAIAESIEKSQAILSDEAKHDLIEIFARLKIGEVAAKETTKLLISIAGCTEHSAWLRVKAMQVLVKFSLNNPISEARALTTWLSSIQEITTRDNAYFYLSLVYTQYALAKEPVKLNFASQITALEKQDNNDERCKLIKRYRELLQLLQEPSSAFIADKKTELIELLKYTPSYSLASKTHYRYLREAVSNLLKTEAFAKLQGQLIASLETKLTDKNNLWNNFFIASALCSLAKTDIAKPAIQAALLNNNVYLRTYAYDVAAEYYSLTDITRSWKESKELTKLRAMADLGIPINLDRKLMVKNYLHDNVTEELLTELESTLLTVTNKDLRSAVLTILRKIILTEQNRQAVMPILENWYALYTAAYKENRGLFFATLASSANNTAHLIALTTKVIHNSDNSNTSYHVIKNCFWVIGQLAPHDENFTDFISQLLKLAELSVCRKDNYILKDAYF
ncbi:MAG: hypothetical protein K0S11_1292, partial [Gammaproteobacteria bacterium]|nr:hypothetical protein [Gammaproteobacteria bacterium]